MFDGQSTIDLRLATVKRDVEALLFAAGAPLTIETMMKAIAGHNPPERELVESALTILCGEFPRGGARGFELIAVGGGWAFRTNPVCRDAVAALFDLPDDAVRLSPAAMEVLAVIAYLQPVSRPQIAEVRGVNSDSPLQRLLERELITEVGRSQGPGGAVLYGTTQRFEAVFGLNGPDDLPDLEGFALGEQQREEIRRRLGLFSTPD